jgi:hypothetical protein
MDEIKLKLKLVQYRNCYFSLPAWLYITVNNNSSFRNWLVSLNLGWRKLRN